MTGNPTLDMVIYTLLSSATVLTAFGVIGKFFKSSGLSKAICNMFNHEIHAELSEMKLMLKNAISEREELSLRLNKVELWQLRQVMDDRRVMLEVRIEAGKEYLERGGNGAYKIKYEELLLRYHDKIEESIV